MKRCVARKALTLALALVVMVASLPFQLQSVYAEAGNVQSSRQTSGKWKLAVKNGNYVKVRPSVSGENLIVAQVTSGSAILMKTVQITSEDISWNVTIDIQESGQWSMRNMSSAQIANGAAIPADDSWTGVAALLQGDSSVSGWELPWYLGINPAELGLEKGIYAVKVTLYDGTEETFDFARSEIKEEGTCGNNLTWTLDEEGTLTISGTGEMRGMDYWMSNVEWSPYSQDIVKVMIEEGVTSIGIGAFNWYTNLEEVELPSTMKNIGGWSFNYCKLKKLVLPSGLEKIGECAFRNCKITEVVIPDSVQTIEGGAFSGNDTLEKLEISGGNNNFVLKDKVLFDKDMTKLICYPSSKKENFYEVPLSVQSIGTAAFASCSELVEVKLPEGLVKIQESAFEGCSKLENIQLPDGLTLIGKNGFNSCIGLTELALPTSLEEIGEGAFEGCNALKEIEIPEKVSKIGIRFISNSGIGTLTVSANNQYFTAKDNVLFDKWMTKLIYYPDTKEDTSYVVPSSVRELSNGAFKDCGHLKLVKLPEGLEKIGYECFLNCDALKCMVIPKSVSRMDDYAVGYSGNWGSNKLVDGIRLVCYDGSAGHQYAVNNGIKSVLLDNNVDGNKVGICGDALIWILDENGTLTISGNGEMSDNTTWQAWRAYQNEICKVVVEEGVSSIGNGAFATCWNLKEVVLPDTLKRIGSSAFLFCESLTELTLPAALEKIDPGAFQGDEKLDLVVSELNKNFKMVDNVVFDADQTMLIRYCTPDQERTAYEVPDTVIVIGDSAFEGRRELTDVKLPNGLVRIGGRAFYRCSLTKVEFPSGLKSIDYYAFEHNALTEIELPSGLESVAPHAFLNCGKLQSITIPASVMLIGDRAFGFVDDGMDENGFKYKMVDNVAISGYTGSVAERYATGNGIAFISLGEVEKITSGNCGIDGDNLKWTFDQDGTLTISGEGEMRDFAGVRPWELCQDQICKLVIEEGVTSIGGRAFMGHKNLTTVKMPESLVKIGGMAFYDCKLAEVEFPRGLKTIDYYAFEHNDLTRIVLPSGLESVGPHAFLNCEKLQSITVPASVRSIGDRAFGFVDDGRDENGFKYKMVDGVVIYGYANSAAQTYATENGIRFVRLGGSSSGGSTGSGSGSSSGGSTSSGSGSSLGTSDSGSAGTGEGADSSDKGGSTSGTKPDGTKTETTTGTKPDGTKTETTTETKPDGTKTEITTETKPDGTKTEITTETKPDGTKTETAIETKADGSTVEVVKETAADGATVENKVTRDASGEVVKTVMTTTKASGAVTEKTVISASENTLKSTVTVKKNSEGVITSAKASCESVVSGKKASLSVDMVNRIVETAGTTDVMVTMTVKGEDGKTKYKLQTSAENLLEGNELFIFKLDGKTGEYTLVNAKRYEVGADGNVAVSMGNKGTYELVDAGTAERIGQKIMDTIVPKNGTATVKSGKQVKFALDKSVNKANIKDIIYTTNKKDVVTVNKNGKIKAVGSGTATVKAKVTLKNGMKKTIKMKVKAK